MRRKLLSIAIVTISGVVITQWLGRNILWSLLPLSLIISTFLCKFSNHKRFYLFLVLSFCVGCLYMSFFQCAGERSRLSRYEEKPHTICGKVEEVQKLEKDNYKIRCQVDGQLLLCSYYHPIDDWRKLIGCEITFTTSVNRPKNAGNPRTFDYNLYLKTKGIFFTAVVDSYQIAANSPSLSDRLKRFVLSRREEMMERLPIDDEAKGLIRGILFGDTNSLDEDIYKEFQRNGTAHVLAVSGLHVGILFSLYRKLNGRRKSLFAASAFLLLLVLYGTATLWSVSVTRAIFLIVLTLAANLLDRRYDLLTALGAVALFIVLKNPYAVMGADFQMSFLAVLSLACFAPILEQKIGGTLAVILSVQLGLLGYMAYNFNYVSFIGILCNIPVVFIISLLVPIGIAGYLWFLAAGSLLPFLSRVLGGLADMAIEINHFFTSDGTLSFDVVSPPLWAVCLLYGVLFFVTSEHFRIYFTRRDWKALIPQCAFLLVMLLSSFFAGYSPFDQASIVFVDVGQGDCIHMKCDDGRNILIDGGGNINYNIGEKTLKPYLLKNGTDTIELAAATHLHTDHFLGLRQLAECFDVREVLTKGKAGQRITLNEEQWIDILWPEDWDPDTDDENLNSLIFKIYDHGVSVLITGDITEEGEMALIKRYEGTNTLRSDVLKAAHHGSSYSTCDDFLKAVDPKAAVISVGKNNYGHPGKVVIEKLQKKGIMIFRTDQSGAVGIINRKGKISICTKNR